VENSDQSHPLAVQRGTLGEEREKGESREEVFLWKRLKKTKSEKRKKWVHKVSKGIRQASQGTLSVGRRRRVKKGREDPLFNYCELN